MRIAIVYDEIAYGGHRSQINFAEHEDHPAGLTGTDLIAIKYAVAMAARGHNVTLFCYGASSCVFDGVKVRNLDELPNAVATERFDVAIATSSPNDLVWFPESTLRMVNRQVARFIEAEVKRDFDRFVDVYLCPSKGAAAWVSNGMPHPEKFAVLPNGCNPHHFGRAKKIPGRVIYCSSPDRGLHLLLSVWPEIRRKVPNASLLITYQSLDGWMKHHSDPTKKIHDEIDAECSRRAHYIKHALNKIGHLGIERVGGGLSHRQIEQELDQAMVFGYPCNTLAFTETFSVSTLEACASGAVPVISSQDALGQIYGNAIPVLPVPVDNHLSEFVNSVVRGLTDENYRDEITSRAKGFAQDHSWDVLAIKLEKIIAERQSIKTAAREDDTLSKGIQILQAIDESRGIIARSAVAGSGTINVQFPKYATKKPSFHLVLSPYASGNIPIDLDDDLADASGGGCRAGFMGLVKALGKRGEYEITAFSTFKQVGVRDGVRYRQYEEFSKTAHRDLALAYYDTSPLVGLAGCVRIASHHTFLIPFPASFEWSDINVAPSAYATNKLRDTYDTSAPWRVLPNAVGDMPITRAPLPGRIIYHTSPSRGLHTLVEAWPRIKAIVPDATLHVVGDIDGWIRDFSGGAVASRQGVRAMRLQSALAAAKAIGGISLLGRLRRSDLLKELGEASVFAFPCSTVTPCETFSISVMECLKIGLPVVMTPADALESIYCGHLAMPEEDKFVDTVCDVLLSPVTADHLSERGKLFAGRYTFESAAHILHEIIEEHRLGRAQKPAANGHTVAGSFTDTQPINIT